MDKTFTIGSEGVLAVLPIIRSLTPDGNFEMVSDENMYEQIGFGDVKYKMFGKEWFVEVKTETRWTGNLFLEEWSNEHVNLGWMNKSNADTLIYYFSDKKVAYLINFHILKKWYATCKKGLQYKTQFKNYQMNKTTGYLMPIPLAKQVCGYDEYELTNGVWTRKV